MMWFSYAADDMKSLRSISCSCVFGGGTPACLCDGVSPQLTGRHSRNGNCASEFLSVKHNKLKKIELSLITVCLSVIWYEAILNDLCHFLKQMTFIDLLRLEKFAAKAFLCTSHSPHGSVCMKHASDEQ